jgi:hypothetical protein
MKIIIGVLVFALLFSLSTVFNKKEKVINEKMTLLEVLIKMTRNILKNLILILNLLVSALCIFLLIYEKIKFNSFAAYNPELFGIRIYNIHFLLFNFTRIFCLMGFLLFIRYLIYTHDKTFSKINILLIPSVIVAIIFIYWAIVTQINNIYGTGIAISALILTIGAMFFVFYYINQKYNLIIKIILCLIFPINILFSCTLVGLFSMY